MESPTEQPKSPGNMREKSVLMVNKSSSKTIKGEVSDSGRNPNRPNPHHFDTFMPWVSRQFQQDVVVFTSNEARRKAMQNRSMKFKHKKNDATDVDTTATPTDAKEKNTKTSVSAFHTGIYADYKAIQILATNDLHQNLIKIEMHNNKEIPRDVLIILSLIVKHYPFLTTLTVNSGINMYSIYEISKLLPRSALKELNLDGTRIRNPNYHILLETASNLTCLSLARCQINDEILKNITDLLAYPLPASKTLTFLSLSSNRISDLGASYLAEALRSNRKLTYLNIADNHISDTGASYIFDILLQFSMVEEEKVQSTSRRFKYIKHKTQLVAQFVVELKIADEMKTVRKRTVAGTKESIKTIPIVDRKFIDKAECLAMKRVGEYKDPFQYPASFTENGKSFCIGNTALASLNLSYNNLSYITLKKLLEVLNYQKDIMQNPKGLFRVRMEGNYLPIICEEYTEINELLKSSIDFHQHVAKKKIVAAIK